MLPDIDIAISDAPEVFLSRAATHVSADFYVELQLDLSTQIGVDGCAMNIRASDGYLAHSNFGVQLIIWASHPRRAVVEARAEEWHPSPPSREAYVAAARAIVSPLLSAYNSANGTRYRMRIKKESRPFALSPRNANNLYRFAVLANSQSLHVLDWRRFYQFAKEARQHIPEGYLRSYLLGAGFPETTANQLDDAYRHLRAYRTLDWRDRY